MRHFVSARLLLFAAFLFILEHSLSPFFSVLGGRIDFLYLLILDYAFFWSWEKAPFFALSVGLIHDFLGAHLFGIETVSLAAAGLVLYFGIQKLERESPWVRLAMTFLFILIIESLNLILGAGLEISGRWSGGLIGSIFWTTIYTTLTAPVFFGASGRWFQRAPRLKQYDLF